MIKRLVEKQMTNKQKDNGQRVPKRIKDVQSYMKKHLGTDVSFDIGYRQLVILEKNVCLYFVTGLCDSTIIQEIIKTLVETNDSESDTDAIGKVIENRLVHQQVEKADSMDEIVDQLLSGLIPVFVEGVPHAYILDIRNYPGRTPEEPDTERVVRGSRDGYTESIVENTALTRRRIRDERLRNEMMKIGERSKTDVCISYLQDVADDESVAWAKEKISKIDIDGIPMADKTIEEFFVDHKWNPYPLVRYTERPDVAAKHLLAGHLLLIIDTSPSIMILPTTFFDHMEHAEEFRQAPSIGTFIRWIRFLAVLASLYLLPLWLLFVIDPSLLPKELAFIGPNEEGNVPIIVQILLADIGVEFLRMAAIHTPTPLATAMGLIAAVMIGEIAVDVGLFSPEVILYVSISTIGSYVTPSYELSVANKIMKLMILILTAFFGAIGFSIGFVISIVSLVSFKAFKAPYLWPFIPFNYKAMVHNVLRVPIPYTNKRPSIVHPKDVYSQPNPETQKK